MDGANTGSPTVLTKDEAEVLKLVAEARMIEEQARREHIQGDKLAAEAEHLVAETRVFEESARRLKIESDTSKFNLGIAEIQHTRVQREEAQLLTSDWFYRTYQFGNEVNDESVRHCRQVLSQWVRIDEPGQKVIELIFSSPGGSVIAGMALFDYIMEIRRQGYVVTTIARGYAASMAGILLQAGSHRVCGAESWILIHEVQAGMMGSWGEIEDRVDWLKRVQGRIIDIFAERAFEALKARRKDHLTPKDYTTVQSDQSYKDFATVQDAKQFFEKEWKRKDWWLSSSEAYECGVVDEVR